ncbi:MAG: restriction endonuclease, partial [Acidobacteria bacterium]|nr:restriction endonuclease [Acidobacteriota bacterium]
RRPAQSPQLDLGLTMHNVDVAELRRNLHWLRGEDGVVPASQAIEVMARVLAPLLAAEGLDLFAPESPGLGVDLFATADRREPRQASLAIEYKHYGQGRPLGVDAVRQLLNNLGSVPYERAMLIGRFGFTAAARETARRREPILVELVDLDGIGAWIRRLESGKPASAERVQLLIRSISHEFAKLVASDADALDQLEWRDLERMVARVMEGLGFETTLTPPSKDGGKDVVLTCNAAAGEESYIIELKHWRAGKRVGKTSVSDFMHVIITEKRAGGLFLSTSGYAADAFEGLTEVNRTRLRLGGRQKIVLLAETYIRACDGLWSPPTALPEVLFDATD